MKGDLVSIPKKGRQKIDFCRKQSFKMLEFQDARNHKLVNKQFQKQGKYYFTKDP